MTVAEALSMLMDLPSGDLQTTLEITREWLVLDPHGAVPRIIHNPEQPTVVEDAVCMVRGDGTDVPMAPCTRGASAADMGRFERLHSSAAQLNGEDL